MIIVRSPDALRTLGLAPLQMQGPVDGANLHCPSDTKLRKRLRAPCANSAATKSSSS